MVRLDYLFMLGLTLFYALFGFYHLGSTQVPENGWYAESAGEAVILDLGESVPATELYVYAGWIDRRYSDQDVRRALAVETSRDGDTWETQGSFEISSVFMWYPYRHFNSDFRYLRLTCDDGRFYLNEAAFFGGSEEVRYPI